MINLHISATGIHALLSTVSLGPFPFNTLTHQCITLPHVNKETRNSETTQRKRRPVFGGSVLWTRNTLSVNTLVGVYYWIGIVFLVKVSSPVAQAFILFVKQCGQGDNP